MLPRALARCRPAPAFASAFLGAPPPGGACDPAAQHRERHRDEHHQHRFQRDLHCDSLPEHHHDLDVSDALGAGRPVMTRPIARKKA
jgi:hypothetical protein